MQIKFHILLFIILFLLILNPHAEGESDEENYTIEVENYYYDFFVVNRKDTIRYNVTVEEGERIDVYIMSASEYEKYEIDEDFSTVVSHERELYFDGEFVVPDNQNYYFIVDNLDNAHNNDAPPSGDVVVNIAVVSLDSSLNNDWAGVFLVFCGAVTFVVLTIIVIAVLVVVMFKKKSVIEPPMPPQSPYQQPPR